MNQMMKARACRGVVIALKQNKYYHEMEIKKLINALFCIIKTTFFLTFDSNFIDSSSN